MIRLLVLIFILVAGLVFGLSLERDQGLVLIVYQGKSYEMALWFCGLVIIISFFIFYYALRFLGGFFGLKQWMSDATAHHRLKKSQSKTNQGLVELAQGQWEKAEKYLLAGAKWNKAPRVNYIFLARTAQAQKAYDRRDHYLALAKELGDIDLVQKELLQDPSVDLLPSS
jgi:HemY protein